MVSYRRPDDDYMDGEVQKRLISRNRPAEQILTCAPMPVIEILSPEDRISRHNERLSDYRSRGIRNIWVIDPARRVALDCSMATWLPVDELHIEAIPIVLPLADMWKELGNESINVG